MSTHPLSGVRRRRDLLGIKASYIAKELGITLSSYIRLETGSRRIYFDKALKLANILSLADIRALADDPGPDESIQLVRRRQIRAEAEAVGMDPWAAEHIAAENGDIDASLLTSRKIASPPIPEPEDARTEAERIKDLLAEWEDNITP